VTFHEDWVNANHATTSPQVEDGRNVLHVWKVTAKQTRTAETVRSSTLGLDEGLTFRPKNLTFYEMAYLDRSILTTRLL
jgi:hypothetical protein